MPYDPLATLTAIVVSTSILMCTCMKQLLDLASLEIRKKTDPVLWYIKFWASIWGIINAVGLFYTIREDHTNSSCNLGFVLANWGSHGVNAFIEGVWLFQVYSMYERNKILGVFLLLIFLLRLGEGIADTFLGLGYIDPVLGCNFIQNQLTGELYELTDLAIDFLTTIFIGFFLYKAFQVSLQQSASLYKSIATTNFIRNVILTVFNVVIFKILEDDPTSPLVVPLFQFQLVLMFGLTVYERDILLFANTVYSMKERSLNTENINSVNHNKSQLSKTG